MENFIFSINSTLPLFLVMVVGFFLKKVGIFTDAFLSSADKFVFKCSLPIMVFLDIANMDLRQQLDIKFVLFCMLTTCAMFLLAWILGKIFVKNKYSVGAFAQGSARGSAAVIGVALVQNMYGNSGQAPMMILAAVPLFNIFSVIFLTLGDKKIIDDNQNANVNKIDKKALCKKLLKGIITNPIIIGIFAGFIVSAFNIRFPVIINSTLNMLAKTASPIALLSIGGAFSFNSSKSEMGTTIFAVALKLLVFPAIFIPIGTAFGFREDKLIAIMIMLASASTPSGYVMAKAMNNNGGLASNIVVFSTLFSCFTLTFWVWILKVFALI